MANTLGITNTQDRIPLLFPGVDNQPVDLGQFLYWFDMAAPGLVAYDRNAKIVGAVTTRPESVVRAHFHNDRNDDDLPVANINGVRALGASTGGTNMLEADVEVGVISQFTFFMVVSKVDESPTETLVKFNGTNGLNVKTVEVSVGGGTHVYDGTAAGISFADGLSHIVVLKWDGADVFIKLGEGAVFEDIGNATTAADNPTSLYVGGDTGTGTSACIGEVMLSANCMDNDEINLVGQYLCRKWRLLWTDLS